MKVNKERLNNLITILNNYADAGKTPGDEGEYFLDWSYGNPALFQRKEQGQSNVLGRRFTKYEMGIALEAFIEGFEHAETSQH